ncbi:hypothetical protein RHMOL_Rhmol01G0144900 [Rhododendron molle]|uniref:Uncharacterized protein n=1 Tax=Rhododendron molle TaxID=49168 RepID=A0ACC0Q175_RHOML|nr:hypothetical protein RHMOL_Rhmol01G0144900 [Rhododendron molle]
MVLCSEVHNTVLCTSEPSDHASNGSNLILATNNRESFITEMRSDPSDVRSDGSEVRNMVVAASVTSSVTWPNVVTPALVLS